MEYYHSPATGNPRQSTATLRFAIIAVLGWSALVAISAYWNFANLQDQIVHLATSEDRHRSLVRPSRCWCPWRRSPR